MKQLSARLLTFCLCGFLCGCDFYSYKNPVCNAVNAISVSKLSGTYQVLVELGAQGGLPPFSGQLAVNLSRPSGDSANLEFNICKVGKRILAEEVRHDLKQTPQFYLVLPSRNGFIFSSIKYSVPRMQKIAPVAIVQIPATHDIPEPVNSYIVDNSELSADVMVKEFQEDDLVKIKFGK